MKCLQMLIFVFTSSIAITNALHSIKWGERKDGDGLISSETITQPAIEGITANVDYSYPSSAEAGNHQVSAIKVTDLDGNGFMELTYWHREARAVTVNLKAPPGEGFRFMVEVFGI